ncbi:alanyl-tRNA synthetase [Desulfosarcina sp. BuS5]|uniref:alanine--tRNA ligase n=1 Tax=Desulfosarcina sp. BuS5 TaxID=933262 RepID=UPI000484831F|nr:alanine--tRNA ligase [Desulfosarcina sp. BuS5]WDN90209.1 alanyl-tRNA synthetase [Desulfosarcina sp. BuS5]
MTGNEIRRQFLKYFKNKNHYISRSASLVPSDDPTLLFTNAGMVQFKRTFLGEEKKDYARAVTSQKCVRAGGKHNDLENVGYTARHHTFFEMLGNFSFGDYFKNKGIEYAWDLLVNGFGLPVEKLWVSIYLKDDEAFDIWHKNIGVSQDRIVRCGEKDNFWSMGDTGPCGPCSEIHIDRGEDFGCGSPDCMVGCECDRFLEIWNLVFMQYNRDDSGKLTPLPRPSIDTGMGLERLASIIQDVPTNYETDLLLPIIRKTEALSEKKFGDLPADDIAMKVIADHTRAAAFLIGDGILPSNEGRGYVLRRIMRRAIRYGRNIGLTRPFLHETANVVFDIMQSAYPELKEGAAFIDNVIKNEEIRFSETLDNGLKLLNDTLSDLQDNGRTSISGDVIFKLYDTYGFPVDIVKDVVRDKEMLLDMEGFDRAMEGQRAQSGSAATLTRISEAYKNLSSKGVKPEFTGYDTLSSDAGVILLVQDGTEVPEASEGQVVEIVTASTPFYGESGGQVGDKGEISGDNFKIDVLNTIKDPTGLIIHKGKVASGKIKKGDSSVLSIDVKARHAIACNHTATHILHSALRQIIGDHVKQAGSLVAADRLRFDFTHFSQIEPEMLDQIEVFVNERIRRNLPLKVEEMDADTAFKSGAMALFEEKYGDRVRVVSIKDFSRELCGGTHTRRTGDIGFFKIIAESSVASGIRRIEALTGESALIEIRKKFRIVQDISRLLREKPDELIPRIEKNIQAQKSLEKEVESLKAKIAILKADSEGDEIQTINNVNLIVKEVSIDKPAALREIADKFKDRIGSGIVVLGSVNKSKALLIAIVTKDLTDRYHAGNIIKAAASVVGGGGGGRPDMAQAGGSKPDKIAQALEKAVEVIKAM